MILLLLFYLLAPAGIIWLCRKVTFFNKIGPILLLYILGIIAGNTRLFPEEADRLQLFLSSAVIPVAIPMMLFNSDFRRFSFRDFFLTLLCGLVAVVISVICGYLFFRNHLGEEGYKIGGLLTGVYTGGTPNMAALKLMLNVREETYIILNSYDMLVCFSYLLFLMVFGIRFFRKILPHTGITATGIASQHLTPENYQEEGDPFGDILKKKNIIQILKATGLSLIILGVSAGLAFLVNENSFMVVLILSLTTLGIIASFFSPVRKLEKSYDAGMYLIYIFSIVIASMADLSNPDLTNSIWLFLYLIFIVFVSLFLQLLFSWLLRIDADTMTISSAALINSPPFVPMIAASMRNKDAVFTGLSIGIVGYAVGNYLGYIISEILQRI